MDEERIARIARALAHPARVQIVRLLAGQPECAGSAIFRELPLAQSTISQHLGVLRRAGLVQSHAVGTGSVYCLVAPEIEAFATSLAGIAAAAPGCAPQDEVADPRQTNRTKGSQR